MGKWLDGLSRVRKPTGSEPSKPPKLGFDGFVGDSSQECPDGRGPLESGDDLSRAIKHARNWDDLEAVLDRAQAAFECGDLDQNAAENLAVGAAARAQDLPEQAGNEPGELRLSDLFRAQPVTRVYSKVLGEYVLFVADGADIPPGDPCVTYRQAELNYLVGLPPEALRAIHGAKQIFDAEVVASNRTEPEIGPADVRHHASGDTATCSSCGQARWWTRAGGPRTCGVCHPAPARSTS